MTRRWYEPVERPPADTTVEERGVILVDLLGLTDALPPVPRRAMTAPPFRELCARR